MLLKIEMILLALPSPLLERTKAINLANTLENGAKMSQNKETKAKSKIFIRLDLEGKIAQQFTKLKDKWGVKNNTELCRLLIVREYERSFPIE
jgi:hypothetical protein